MTATTTRTRIETIEIDEIPGQHRRMARSLLKRGEAFLEYRRVLTGPAEGRIDTALTAVPGQIGHVGMGGAGPYAITCVEQIEEST